MKAPEAREIAHNLAVRNKEASFKKCVDSIKEAAYNGVFQLEISVPNDALTFCLDRLEKLEYNVEKKNEVTLNIRW